MDTLPVPGHPGYFVSADGSVWSEARSGLRRMKPSLQVVGRYHRHIINLGRGNRWNVAALVCTVFHGPRPVGHEVAHLNGDSLDNQASNLAWKTRTENERDKVPHGTSNRGARQHQAKLTDDDVREIRRMAAEGHPQIDMVARFGISQPTVSEIVRRKKWAWLD